MAKKVNFHLVKVGGQHRQNYVFTPVVDGIDTELTLRVTDTLTEHHLQELLEFLGHEVTFTYEALEQEHGPR